MCFWNLVPSGSRIPFLVGIGYRVQRIHPFSKENHRLDFSIMLKFQLEKIFGILYRNKGPEKAPKSPAWTVAFKACSQSKGPSNWSACVLKMSWTSHTTKLYTTHHLMPYPIRYMVFISYFINISGFSKLNQIVIIYVPWQICIPSLFFI